VGLINKGFFYVCNNNVFFLIGVLSFFMGMALEHSYLVNEITDKVYVSKLMSDNKGCTLYSLNKNGQSYLYKDCDNLFNKVD
jgi:hypothetical protein